MGLGKSQLVIEWSHRTKIHPQCLLTKRINVLEDTIDIVNYDHGDAMIWSIDLGHN
jgi:hypothetical protein